MKRALAFAAMMPFPALGQDGGVPDAPRGGEGQSAIEARIAAFNPCEPLGANFAGISLGVDRVHEVQVEHADLRLDGDGVTFEMAGRMVCRDAQGDEGSDLAADVAVYAEGLLSRCEVTATEVDVTNTEGALSWALDLASPVIDGLLSNRIREEAETACRQLAG